MSPLTEKTSCTLMISTYNWPEALARVLESARRQTRVPDEIIVADDGSGEPTRKLIETFRRKMPCPLIHVWQEDLGFRKCMIWNEAIRHAKGDYIVQIDGDCMLDADFIADHLRFAKPGTFVCGSRTLLSRELTQALLADPRLEISPFSRGVNNKVNALRIRPLSKFFAVRYRANVPYISKGCNMAFWRKDLLAVNGYNETISGWGREDAEIEVRLMKLGIQRRSLKFGGVQYHLFHKELDRSRDARNIEILNRALASDEFRTPHGIVKESVPASAEKTAVPAGSVPETV